MARAGRRRHKPRNQSADGMEQDLGHRLAMSACQAGATARRPSGATPSSSPRKSTTRSSCCCGSTRRRAGSRGPARSATGTARTSRCTKRRTSSGGTNAFHESQNYRQSFAGDRRPKLVVVHFGNGDLAAYDFDGKQLWQRNLQKDYGDYTIWWGHANSPVLYGDLVISICVQDSCADLPGKPSPSYVVAHDRRTGRERWKTMRMTAATPRTCDSYTTPILWNNNGRLELVVMGGQMLDAYDPATGKRLWYLPDLMGNRTITGPVAAQGMIYVTQGMQQPLLAVRPGGDGQADLARTWRGSLRRARPTVPRRWSAGESLLLVTNDGIARCLNAVTGRVQWKERLKGEYRASPLAADGRIYFLNTQGLTTVVAASPQFQPAGREPARRRNAGLAGRFRRANLYSRPKSACIAWANSREGTLHRRAK